MQHLNLMLNLHKRWSRVHQFLLGLNLQSRFLLVIGTTALCFAIVIWGVFSSVSERLVERLGARFAEKQVLYDKARTLQPLIREVALARQMADSPIIKRWAANEQDVRLRQSALEEMEKFRRHFHDGSYFLALGGSGHYYFNNAGNEYAGKQLRYTLSPGSRQDAWFYATMKSGSDYLINVDPDASLGVTKVWVNVLLRDGDKVLGVLGTGLDLTDFIRKVADISQPGITNLFVDHNAAIQVYRDVAYIDYSSIAKSSDRRRSVDQLLHWQEDRDWVRQAIRQVGDGKTQVSTKFVRINGKRYLAGVAALPEVGWYDITLLDLGILLPRYEFLEMGLAISMAVLGLLGVLALTLHRLVLRPVAGLTEAAARIGRGEYASATLEESGGEVGQLTVQFEAMADAVHKTQSSLEIEIEKRTHQLTDAKAMLEAALEQERESRETQSHLLALMAHEIRSPVAVISNTAQMLNVLAQSEQPDWKPRIEKILGAVRRLTVLMDNLLAEERLSVKSHGLERQAGDLNTFCAGLAASCSETHGRPVRFEPWRGDALLYADWQLVDIAVRNLIDNAVKYDPGNGDICVRIQAGLGDMLCIEVSDQGLGIPAEMQQRIFEKFIRGENLGGVSGVGLGLYLVNWIAGFHGGVAEVASIPGGGSTFRIHLPGRQH